MPINSGMMSSNSSEWETPQELFDRLHDIHHFTLDVCASDTNHKVAKYYTKETNGMLQEWKGEICWMNPPYGREIKHWVYKAHNEWIFNNTKIVMLLPARTDTKWFHQHIYKIGDVQFLKGRLKFSDSKNAAPFPSMIVTYYPRLDF